MELPINYHIEPSNLQHIPCGLAQGYQAVCVTFNDEKPNIKYPCEGKKVSRYSLVFKRMSRYQHTYQSMSSAGTSLTSSDIGHVLHANVAHALQNLLCRASIREFSTPYVFDHIRHVPGCSFLAFLSPRDHTRRSSQHPPF